MGAGAGTPAEDGSALRRALARAGRCGWRRSLILAVFATLLLLPGLAALPVTDRDEARFAQASKQMLERGDFIDIRFQDKPRWKKPAGIYWLQSGSAALAGGADAPIWAYRLPSLAGAVLAAVLLGWAIRPLAGPGAALLAGLMLPATLLVAAEATIAKTDAMLLATAVAVFGGLVRLAVPAAPPPRPSPARGEGEVRRAAVPDAPQGEGRGIADMTPAPGTPSPLAGEGRGGGAQRLGTVPALAIWAALAAAILLKGPIVPLIALLALLWLWAMHRRPPPLARLHPGAGLALVLLLVAPWLIAIWAISDGAFFVESVGKDLLAKVEEGKERHWGPPGLYLALVWLTFWPWAAMLVPAAPWLWQQRRAPWVILVAGWVLPFWLLLEAVPTKLPHYVLPLYPALVMALALWSLTPDRPATSARLRRINAALVAIPGVLLGLAMLALPLWLEGRVVPLALLAAAIAAPALWLAARAARADRPLAQIGASLIAAATLYAGVLQGALPALSTVFPSPRIVALAAPWLPCASGPLVSAGYREPSLVFLAGTGTRLPGPAETARLLAEGPGALVLVEDRWMERHLRPAWGADPPDLVERGALGYFNYNRGSMETARLWTRADPRWNACADTGRAAPAATAADAGGPR